MSPDQIQLNQWGLLALRIGVGVVFLAHGNAKRKFWQATPSEQLPIQLLTILRMLSIAEPIAGLAVILGILTRLASLGHALGDRSSETDFYRFD